MIALVGDSISRIPGPPRGPSWRMTTTCPFFTRPRRMASSAASSRSKTSALPREPLPFLAADLRDGAVGREVAVQDDQVAVLFDRIVESAHDILAGRIGRRVRQILAPASCR